MGKAPKHGKQRQTQHSTTTTQQPLGISKLKAALRQAERFLRRDGLPADQRVEAQRRVESLQSQLRDAEASRPAVMADAPETPVGTMDRPKRVKSKTPAGGTDSYKMLRHFEYVKTARRVKSTRKEMARVEEQLANVKNADNPDEKDAKKLKSRLKKDRKRLEEDLMDRRVDAWYVETFPRSRKYISLFPQGEFISHTPYELPSALSVTDNLAAEAALPSAKSPDDVRAFWRAVVRAQLEAGILTGEPLKQKKAKTVSTPGAHTASQATAIPASSEHVDAEENENEDDFFA
ncbi:18S rRNA maturation protein [Cystobasidiomycetes sp. EMM_F5]